MQKFLFRPAAPKAHAQLKTTAPKTRAIFGLAVPWLCAWLVLSPVAQAAEAKPAPEPAPATQPPPFDHYQTWRDEPPSDWIKANDRVGEVGGWRTYAREAQQGDDSAEQSRHRH